MDRLEPVLVIFCPLVEQWPHQNVLDGAVAIEQCDASLISCREQQLVQGLDHWSYAGPNSEHGDCTDPHERILQLDVVRDVLKKSCVAYLQAVDEVADCSCWAIAVLEARIPPLLINLDQKFEFAVRFSNGPFV